MKMPTSRRWPALILFHVGGGARVASRNAIATIGAIIIVLGSAPDPWLWLRFLALGVAGAGFGSGPLIGLAAIAAALARDAVPRLTLGLGGWTRSLPATGEQHRRAVVYGLPIIQLPLVVSALLAALLTVLAYHIPLAWPKLAGMPVALLAAGAAAVPARRGLLTAPVFAVATVLASLGRWDALGAVGRAVRHRRSVRGQPAVPCASQRRCRCPRRRVLCTCSGSPGAPSAGDCSRRAPMSALALAAAWFYSRNNELNATDTAFVARLWSVIAIALYVGAVGDTVGDETSVVAMDPVTPVVEQGSRGRQCHCDRGARCGHRAGCCGGGRAGGRRSRSRPFPPLAMLASWLLHGARRRLTRVSGSMIVVGALLGTAVAFWPSIIVAALAATPLLLRAAAHGATGARS